MSLIDLFEDKKRLLTNFLNKTREFRARFEQPADMEARLDLVDELSDLREQNLRVMQRLDQHIDITKRALNRQSIEKLQGDDRFKTLLEETLQLIKEIQLTDQSLFLYIQNMGIELRAQILKGLKEKEAVSKFKSHVETTSGDELDKTV